MRVARPFAEFRANFEPAQKLGNVSAVARFRNAFRSLAWFPNNRRYVHAFQRRRYSAGDAAPVRVKWTRRLCYIYIISLPRAWLPFFPQSFSALPVQLLIDPNLRLRSPPSHNSFPELVFLCRTPHCTLSFETLFFFILYPIYCFIINSMKHGRPFAFHNLWE